MAGGLAKGTSTWRLFSQHLQLPGRLYDRVMLSGTATFSTPILYAALGTTRAKKTEKPAKSKPPKPSPVETKEKRPASAYALYLREAFPKAKDLNPSADFKTISKQVAEQWKSLNESQKSSYRESFEVAKKDYVARNDKPAKKKGPLSPFAVFVKENYNTLRKADESVAETMKSISAKWRSLSAAEKDAFKQKAYKS